MILQCIWYGNFIIVIRSIGWSYATSFSLKKFLTWFIHYSMFFSCKMNFTAPINLLFILEYYFKLSFGIHVSLFHLSKSKFSLCDIIILFCFLMLSFIYFYSVSFSSKIFCFSLYFYVGKSYSLLYTLYSEFN